MFSHRAPSRRDKRFPLSGGNGRIWFRHPVTGRQCAAELTLLCAAGLAFVLPPEMGEIGPGSSLTGASLEIGGVVLRGDVLIKSSGANDGGGVTLGGLFYPATREFEQRFEGLVAGLSAGGRET